VALPREQPRLLPADVVEAAAAAEHLASRHKMGDAVMQLGKL
jgi:hypothetical protein